MAGGDNALYQKRWRDKCNELAKWALENKRYLHSAEEYRKTMQENAALKEENAALRKRLDVIEARVDNWSWQDAPQDIARAMLESYRHKAPMVFAAGMNLIKPTAKPVQQKPRRQKKPSP